MRYVCVRANEKERKYRECLLLLFLPPSICFYFLKER